MEFFASADKVDNIGAMIGRVVLLILSIVATTLPCTAAQPALETIRIGIPGKLVDFAPFFVGSNMVDPALIGAAKQSAEGVTGFSLIPLLPDSQNPDMLKWVANWRREYPNAPAGRPNNFDLLAYGDMYVVAEGLTGMDAATFEKTAKEAEGRCPISNALRGSLAIEVLTRVK